MSRSQHPSSPRFSPDWFMGWFPVVMRYGALFGVAHQAIWREFDRPSLLALYGAMLGLSEIAEALKDMQQSKRSGDEEA